MCSILPEDCCMKVLRKELFPVFLGMQSDPMKRIQKNRGKKKSFYPAMMKSQEVQEKSFLHGKVIQTKA